MKELIAACIVLPLLFSLIPQYGMDVVNDRTMNRVDNIVHSAKEIAREEGRFTNENINDITEKLEALGFSPDEIKISVTTTSTYRSDNFDENNLIKYKIGVPIKKIIAANKFFGIPDEENKTTYYVTGSVASELLESE